MFQMPKKMKFGQRTPPAIYPPVFGLLGLGLAWRRAEAVFMTPAGIADLILGMVSLLFVWCLFTYAVKFARRPGVVAADLKILPGRAGLAAAALSIYLMAAILLPFSPGLSNGVLFFGLACHFVLVAIVLTALLTGPAEQRQVTPIWQLVFVGFVITPLAGIPLGYVQAATIVYYASAAIAVGIWAASLVQLVRRDPPPPLRPLLAIHLAPAALLGIVGLMLDMPLVATGFAIWGALILAALLIKARYLTEAGFSPLWGAFTFPLAAYANLLLALANGHGGVFVYAGGILLVAATLIIPPIAFKVLQAWAKGQLAAKTNAAIA